MALGRILNQPEVSRTFTFVEDVAHHSLVCWLLALVEGPQHLPDRVARPLRWAVDRNSASSRIRTHVCEVVKLEGRRTLMCGNDAKTDI
jgi:hypothetical protein